jgi:uncharacterized protein (TIGR03663 family)
MKALRSRRLIASKLFLSRAWFTIFLLALGTRFLGIGDRSMGHDESQHAYFSWVLSETGRYQHDPMLHGPLLFHVQAALFRLFGDRDSTARLWPALSGVFVVLVPWLYRRELGSRRALVAAALLLLSPTLGFYSRYLRNDLWCAGMTALWLRALLDFRAQAHLKSLILLAASMAGHLASKETAFLVGAVLGGICLAMGWSENRTQPEGACRWIWLGVVQLHWVSPYLPGGILALLGSPSLGDFESLAAISQLGWAAVSWCLTAFLFLLWPQSFRKTIGRPFYPILLGLLLWSFLLTLYTSGGRNPRGLASGVLGSLGYWIAQHEVERGGQPPWFYGLLAGIYEPMTLLGGVAAWFWLLKRRPFRTANKTNRQRFFSFLVPFAALSWLAFSWAGERMPWLLTHLVVPSVLLAVAALPGPALRCLFKKRVFAAAIAVACALLLLSDPEAAVSLHLGLRGAMAVLLVLLGWILFHLPKPKLRIQPLWRLAACSIAIFLVFQARSLLLLLGSHAEDARELLFYAHGTPDLLPIVSELEFARRKAHALGAPWRVAQSSALTWPLAWYLRREPHLERFSQATHWNPKELPDAILLAREEEGSLRPEVLARLTEYRRIPFRSLSWPPDGYRTWGAPEWLDPSTFSGLLRYWLHRETSVFGAPGPQSREALLYLRPSEAAGATASPKSVFSSPIPQR